MLWYRRRGGACRLELVKRDEDTDELIKSSIKKWFASDNDDLFDRLLDDVANAFVYWLL